MRRRQRLDALQYTQLNTSYLDDKNRQMSMRGREREGGRGRERERERERERGREREREGGGRDGEREGGGREEGGRERVAVLTSIFSSSSWRNSPSPLTLVTILQLLAHNTAREIYSIRWSRVIPGLRERGRMERDEYVEL